MSQEIVFCQFESDHDREGMLVWELFGEEMGSWNSDFILNLFSPNSAAGVKSIPLQLMQTNDFIF